MPENRTDCVGRPFVYEKHEEEVVNGEVDKLKKLIDTILNNGSENHDELMEQLGNQLIESYTVMDQKLYQERYEHAIKNKKPIVGSWAGAVQTMGEAERASFFLGWLLNAPIDDDNNTLLHYVATKDIDSSKQDNAKNLCALLIGCGAKFAENIPSNNSDLQSCTKGQLPFQVCVNPELENYLREKYREQETALKDLKKRLKQRELINTARKKTIESDLQREMEEEEKAKKKRKNEPNSINIVQEELKDNVEIEEQWSKKLFKAVEQKDYKQILSLVGPENINAKDEKGFTLLYYAALNNDTETTDLLCMLGAEREIKVGLNNNEASIVEHIVIKIFNDAKKKNISVAQCTEEYQEIIRMLDPYGATWNEAMKYQSQRQNILYSEPQQESIWGYFISAWVTAKKEDREEWLVQKSTSPFIRHILENSDQEKYKEIIVAFLEKCHSYLESGATFLETHMNTIGKVGDRLVTLYDVCADNIENESLKNKLKALQLKPYAGIAQGDMSLAASIMPEHYKTMNTKTEKNNNRLLMSSDFEELCQAETVLTSHINNNNYLNILKVCKPEIFDNNCSSVSVVLEDIIYAVEYAAPEMVELLLILYGKDLTVGEINKVLEPVSRQYGNTDKKGKFTLTSTPVSPEHILKLRLVDKDFGGTFATAIKDNESNHVQYNNKSRVEKAMMTKPVGSPVLLEPLQHSPFIRTILQKHNEKDDALNFGPIFKWVSNNETWWIIKNNHSAINYSINTVAKRSDRLVTVLDMIDQSDEQSVKKLIENGGLSAYATCMWWMSANKNKDLFALWDTDRLPVGKANCPPYSDSYRLDAKYQIAYGYENIYDNFSVLLACASSAQEIQHYIRVYGLENENFEQYFTKAIQICKDAAKLNSEEKAVRLNIINDVLKTYKGLDKLKRNLQKEINQLGGKGLSGDMPWVKVPSTPAKKKATDKNLLVSALLQEKRDQNKATHTLDGTPSINNKEARVGLEPSALTQWINQK